MKIISLNSSDTFGGAARAAYRLQAALRDQGADARLMVQRKCSDNPWVIGPANPWQRGLGLARNQIDALPLAITGRRADALFSLSFVPSDIVARINGLHPDVVHLHWICEGLTSIGKLAYVQAPVIWTLHDSWPFTGGCHVPYDCTAYQQRCGRCPQLGSSSTFDLSRIGWSRKQSMFRQLQPVIVSPSRWLGACAADSSLMGELRIEIIPNGIDTDRFKPSDKVIARRLLGMEEGKRILLFSAVDGLRHHHKGFHLLKHALTECSRCEGFRDSTLLYVAGCSAPDTLPDLPVPVRFLGHLSDDVAISLLYNAADLYLAPALLENFSTTVLESLACGTPCVAYNAGGMCDLIDHEQNGYLARAYDVEDFARGIIWSIETDDRLALLSAHGRRKVEERFTLDMMARRHMDLYEDVWARSRS